MQITSFSLFSSVIWSSVLILVIYLFRKFRPFKDKFSLWVPILLYLFCAARLLLPGEFPFSIVLPDRHIYASVYRFLKTEHTLGGHLRFSFLHLLFLVWLLTAGILLLRLLIRCRRAMAAIRSRGQNCGRKEYKIFRAAAKTAGKLPKISLRFFPDLPTPMGAGIFRRYILLPQREYSEKELYYILLHESTHFLNRDIPIKLMISVFCCIFWWNPAVYLLKADLEQTLEMKCDAAVSRNLDRVEKVVYLRTILNCMKWSSSKKASFYDAVCLFDHKKAGGVKERFAAVIKDTPALSPRWANLLLVISFCLLLAASYLFIPQPAYDPPVLQNTPHTTYIDADDIYVLQKADGTYWLCTPASTPRKLSDEDLSICLERGFQIKKESQ